MFPYIVINVLSEGPLKPASVEGQPLLKEFNMKI